MLQRGIWRPQSKETDQQAVGCWIASIWPHFNPEKVDIFRSVVLGDQPLFWQPDRVVFMRFVQGFTWSVFSFSSQIMYVSVHTECLHLQGVHRRVCVCPHISAQSVTLVAQCENSFLKVSLVSVISFEIWSRWLLHQRSVDHRLAEEVRHRGDSFPLQETHWWAGVFRGVGSYPRKPGCHGIVSFCFLPGKTKNTQHAKITAYNSHLSSP